MGSYDTGETYERPSRSIRDPTTSDNTEAASEETNVAETRNEQNSTYEVGEPILVKLGGGLTPSRIVKKLPEEYADKLLIEVVKYMISPENITTNEETSIADAVRERMGANNYRAIINDRFNFHNDKLKTDVLKDYLIGDVRHTEGGDIKYNKTDIAIVTHEEGGTYKTIDTIV